MQLPLVGELISMFVNRILSEVFPNETGAARLQQVGLFTLIFMLEQNEEPITVGRLVELTGQSRSAVSKQVAKLEKIDVVERTKASPKRGRGYVILLSIKHTEKTRRLLKAIGEVSNKQVARIERQRNPGLLR
jgi:predicted transcriptional regulator